MSDVWLGRLNRWVEKHFNVKGGPTVVDLAPTVQVQTIWQEGVEDRVLQGWNRFGALAVAPAVAGQNSAIMIRNPAASNMVAVIEYAFVYQQTAVTRTALNLQIANGIADLATTVIPLRLDFRQKQGATSIVSFGTTGASGNFMSEVVSGTTAKFILTHDQELAVVPSDQYIIVDSTQNEAITAGFVWRERALESSELT